MRTRSHYVATATALSCICAAFLNSAALGQTPPVKTNPVVPAAGVAAPATPAKKPAPFDRYRKYDQLPELTRELVFATQRGMEWLSRDGIHMPNGRFVPGLNPALGKATDDDHFIRQALGALALARAARLTGEEKYNVRAAQTVLSLLAETPKDAAQPAMRTPSMSNTVCNRVGAAAILALAIFELPDAAAELRQCGEELCSYIRSRAQADGSIRCVEAGETADGDGALVHPCAALAALAASHRLTPEAWKEELVAKGLTHYRKQFQTAPHTRMTPWLTAAAVDMHLSAKTPVFAETAFEMADWLVKIQYASPERNRVSWRGGFPVVADGKIISSAPTIDSADGALALAEACRMIRQMEKPDTGRYDRYSSALTRVLQFLTTLQYGEDNTLHFAAQFRPALLGAFHPSLTDGNVRIDHTAAAVSALCQYLLVGADR